MSSNDCECDTGIIFGVSQCRSCGCGPSTCSPADLSVITQKRIWNSVRVPTSEYTMNLGSLSVYQKPLPVNPSLKQYGVNWNQMSDRVSPSNSNVSSINIVPSHGNSTRSSITRERPGSQRPGGKGVDIKHGSYARYLARLKGKGPLRTSVNSSPPVQGNKTKSYGIVGRCLCFN
mgnify:FL=1